MEKKKKIISTKRIIPTFKISTKSKGRQSVKAGLPPGTLVYVGSERETRPIITAYAYNEDRLDTFEDASVEQVEHFMTTYQRIWVNVEGVHDIELIRKFGKLLGLHKLTQEDIVNTIQRPKWDEFANYGFTSIKMLYLHEEQIVIEQVSIVLTKNCVVTFQEQKQDVFDSIRERLRNPTLALRSRGEDYLFYALIDDIISHYFICMERLEDQISGLQETVYGEIPPDFSFHIQQVADELINLKKIIMPLRTCVNQWGHEDNSHISKDVRLFFSDLKDQVLTLTDNLDGYRDVLNNLQNLHFTIINHQMNEVSRTLTVIATLFIPLTFIVGIYGMNFEFMPELGWKYSYFIVLGIMLIIVIIMLFYFRRKRWI